MLQFLVIGAVLFAADRVRTDLLQVDEPLGAIVLDASTLDRLAREAIAQTGRVSSERQLRRWRERYEGPRL